jgi:hypothetical protein
MSYLTPITIVVVVCAIVGCAPGVGRANEGSRLLWLPSGAATDAGVGCYADGSCDLSFTSFPLDPNGLTGELERHFSGAEWEQRCPAPPAQRGWQPFLGSGVVGLGSDVAVSGTSRYWHCAWHGPNGDVISYHLQVSTIRDGRQPLTGYATYTTRSADR